MLSIGVLGKVPVLLSTTVLDSRYMVSTGADRWSRCDRAAFTDLGQPDYDLQQRDRIEYVDVPIPI